MALENGNRHATARWAGVIAVEEASVELSHGIAPGTFSLRIQPQSDDKIPVEGDLIIEDGIGVIKIPGCRIVNWRRNQSNGFVDELIINDRRWKWLTLNRVAGCYNQLDPHAKLNPWTIRSPTELAIALLEAMGEEEYDIDLPDGLTKQVGLNFAGLNPPFAGVQPVLGTNPPVDWEDGCIPPAVALGRLAQQYGRRVVYQWKTDSVAIVKPGEGDPLPRGDVSRVSPSFKKASRPGGVEIVGSPTRYQMRLRLKAVGRDWDGQYRPINELSYTPRQEAKRQITEITLDDNRDTLSPLYGREETYRIYLNAGPNDPANRGVQFEATYHFATTAATNLAAQINASQNPNIKNLITAEVVGDLITLTGPANGSPFAAWTEMRTHNGGSIKDEMTQAPRVEGRSWAGTVVGDFSDVVSTDELNYFQALDLARSTVFLDYQVDDVDASGEGKIHVPGYGLLDRRQQIVLNPTKCEQIVPFPQDVNLRDGIGRPLTVNLYNGYSRDQPAIVYGRAFNQAVRKQFYYIDPNNPVPPRNTEPDRQLHVHFNIDATEQVVHFTVPIYVHDEANRVIASPITLETAVNIRNADTNALECYSKRVNFPGKQGDEDLLVQKRADVQMNIIGDYDILGFVAARNARLPGGQLQQENRHKITGSRRLENDPSIRAKYYAENLMLQFEDTMGLTTEFSGLVPVDLDGLTQQVSWHLTGGQGGFSTTVSQNTEHSLVTIPYPTRVRREFIDPVPQDPALRRSVVDDGLMAPRGRS